MKEHLQPWYDKWRKDNHDTDLVYVPKNDRGEPSLRQVHFVRDNLANIIFPYDKRGLALPHESKETAYVIGEHTYWERAGY